LPQPLSFNPSGPPFIELQSVDSTNNYARQLIQSVYQTELPVRQSVIPDLAQHQLAVFAHEQVAGKGQRGKVWASEKGSNIVMSILINPYPLRLTAQFQLSVCAAVALHNFFIKYTGGDASIKWPNDLYWQDRKAGGILIENIVAGQQQDSSANPQWKWAIIGIGININQTNFSPVLPNPVSLKQITGKNFDPVVLAKELHAIFIEKYNSLLQEGFENMYTQYLTHLYKRNKAVRLKKDNRVFEAVIKTVLPTGRLVVQHSIEEEFDFGGVEWVIR
jgi:BirA family transcriptional regulator, biotin operon repressor / biotin---[acetyl-CoA-carboxylase] ligase